MRLTFEALGRTLVLALERDAPAEPIHPRGDIFATTERRESYDYDDHAPIGFLSGKRTK